MKTCTAFFLSFPCLPARTGQCLDPLTPLTGYSIIYSKRWEAVPSTTALDRNRELVHAVRIYLTNGRRHLQNSIRPC